MTQYLPPNLLSLFAARDPIPYLPPIEKLPSSGYTGIAEFVNNFEDPSETPPPVKIETREERQEKKRKAKAEFATYKLEQDIALWQPSKNPNATSDPYKTLFVARISYDISESKLRRDFEFYGPIKKLVLVHDLKGKPRGYAFIEYESTRDMRSAYKHADGKKIAGKRVLVDVERGRVVRGWLPRRLGGGLGETRKGGPEVSVKHSGRSEQRADDRYYMDRDRDRPERPERRRSRSRSRERKRKSRSRSRDRHRSDRHKRERSRDRDGVGADKVDGVESTAEPGADGEPARKERRRSRSRDRRRRRSRSRDRKRRDHDKDRESRRERERKRGGDREERKVAVEEPPLPEPSQESFLNNEYDGEYNNFNNNSIEASNFEGY